MVRPEDAWRELEDDIRSFLDPRPEPSGWYSCYCPVCGANRKTGGFFFDQTDQAIIYKCFRASCGADTGFSYENIGRVPRKFRDLMDSIGVAIPVPLLLRPKGYVDKREKSNASEDPELDPRLYKTHGYSDIKLPGKYCSVLDKPRSVYGKFLDRGILPEQLERHFFVFSSGKYSGVPFVKFVLDRKIIGYQLITPSKYITEIGGNKEVLFLTGQRTPRGGSLVIVEGIMDALSLPDGFACAVLGKRMTKGQAYVLRNVRERIWLPDRTGNDFVEQAGEYGDPVCIPKLLPGKDLNEALVRTRSRAMVADSIRQGTIRNSPTKALVEYRLWLQKTQKRKGSR